VVALVIPAAAYGDLYQWGRAEDGHEDRTRNSTSATLTSGIDTGANDLFIMTSALPFDWQGVEEYTLCHSEKGSRQDLYYQMITHIDWLFYGV
jgi:hypothetical protein